MDGRMEWQEIEERQGDRQVGRQAGGWVGGQQERKKENNEGKTLLIALQYES